MQVRSRRCRPIRREVRIDYWGALFITVAASLPLVWVSFAGHSFAWWSVETAEFLGAAAVAATLMRPM